MPLYMTRAPESPYPFGDPGWEMEGVVVEPVTEQEIWEALIFCRCGEESIRASHGDLSQLRWPPPPPPPDDLPGGYDA